MSHNFVNDSLMGLLYTTFWHMEDSGITKNFTVLGDLRSIADC